MTIPFLVRIMSNEDSNKCKIKGISNNSTKKVEKDINRPKCCESLHYLRSSKGINCRYILLSQACIIGSH